MTDNNINQLQRFLNENEIPIIKSKPKTFLDIAKQPHYENVLSNLYAFYFDINEDHKLKDLFISSLLKCISKSKLKDQKGDLQSFYDFDIETEYTTNKGGRIDLLMHNKDQAIIIENKVYHTLNNDLFDYWNTVKISSGNDANKLGIILSLRPVSDISHPHFINITHIDLLETVMKNCGIYLLEANSKYVTFLKDLYQNIMNLSKPNMEEKDLRFYFKNQTEINQLAKFKFAVRDHIIAEVEKAGQSLDGMNLLAPRSTNENNKRLRYYVSSKNSNLMVTVVFEDLLNEKKSMYIAVELMEGALRDRKSYDSIDSFTEEEKSIFTDHFRTTYLNWAHFALQHYHPSDTEVATLSQYILNKLKDDHFLTVFNKIELFLEAEKLKINN